MSTPKLIPELYCSDFDRTLSFYTETLGFAVEYARPEERFAMLSFEGAYLMIEQTIDADRTFLAAAPEYPFGRGMNLQIETADVRSMYRRVVAGGAKVFLLEERWYRCGDEDRGNRQFVAMDPDGYLLRFAEDLGSRESTSASVIR